MRIYIQKYHVYLRQYHTAVPMQLPSQELVVVVVVVSCRSGANHRSGTNRQTIGSWTTKHETHYQRMEHQHRTSSNIEVGAASRCLTGSLIRAPILGTTPAQKACPGGVLSTGGPKNVLTLGRTF